MEKVFKKVKFCFFLLLFLIFISQIQSWKLLSKLNQTGIKLQRKPTKAMAPGPRKGERIERKGLAALGFPVKTDLRVPVKIGLRVYSENRFWGFFWPVLGKEFWETKREGMKNMASDKPSATRDGSTRKQKWKWKRNRRKETVKEEKKKRIKGRTQERIAGSENSTTVGCEEWGMRLRRPSEGKGRGENDG